MEPGAGISHWGLGLVTEPCARSRRRWTSIWLDGLRGRMPDGFLRCGGMPVCSVRDRRIRTGEAALNYIGARHRPHRTTGQRGRRRRRDSRRAGVPAASRAPRRSSPSPASTRARSSPAGPRRPSRTCPRGGRPTWDARFSWPPTPPGGPTPATGLLRLYARCYAALSGVARKLAERCCPPGRPAGPTRVARRCSRKGSDAASMRQTPSPCPSRVWICAPVCGIRNHGK